MRHATLRQPITTATLFIGWLHDIECDPALWDWPTSTAAYLRFRVGELTAELVDGATGTAVVA